MALSASASPTSGVTPGSFSVDVSGGVPPYDVALAGSPPNSTPPPDVTITGTNPGPWEVEVHDGLGTGDKVWIQATDQDVERADVSYTSD